MYQLIKFSDNYCDDLPIEGCWLVPQDEFSKYKWELENNIVWPTMIFFGDSYGIQYKSKEEYLGRMEIIYLEKERYFYLKSLFGERYGMFPHISPLDKKQYLEHI